LLVEEHERGRVLVRVARRVRLMPFFGASLVAFTGLAALAFVSAEVWPLAAPIAIAAAMTARAAWHGAATLALADRVIAKVLIDAGAVPVGRLATQVTARIPAPPRDVVEPVSLGPLGRPREVALAASRSAIVSTARHAS
jgi:hypothetical protein